MDRYSDPQKVKYQVFVSSTFKEMDEVRKIAIEAIQKCEHIHIAMEGFTAKYAKQRPFASTVILHCSIRSQSRNELPLEKRELYEP